MAKSTKGGSGSSKKAAPAKGKAPVKPGASKGGRTVKAADRKPAPAAKGGSKPGASSKAPVKKPEPSAAKSDGKVGKPSPAKPTAAPAKAAPPTAAGAGAAPAPAGGANAAGAKVPPKGITVVPQRPMKKPKPKKLEMPASEPLLKPGGKWKPLIPSGPKAPPTGLVGQGPAMPDEALLSKNRLNKKELDKYREILLRKRAELVGDVAGIEDEALRQNSGSLSSLPQHMAEQGSDTFDQSISLDLAQVDRNLIREIDEALQRIEAGTYGVCLRTGQRISADRLAEIPWAKYSIEAQRELERRPFHHSA